MTTATAKRNEVITKIFDRQDKYEEITVDAKHRTYKIHFPKGASPGEKLPLMIVLHGGGGNALLTERITGFNKKADEENFIVVYPNGSGKFKHVFLTWNAIDCCGYAKARNIDDVSFIKELIKTLVNRYSVDPGRVYVSGFSNGAMLAYCLATELPDQIAACAIVSGSMSGKEQPPDSAVPLIIFHGIDDKHVPFNGGTGKLAKWGFPVNKEPVDYALNFWKNVNQCPSTQKIFSNATFSVVDFKNNSNTSLIRLVTINKGRHAWPGGRKTWLGADSPSPVISATDEIWSFCKGHQRNK